MVDPKTRRHRERAVQRYWDNVAWLRPAAREAARRKAAKKAEALFGTVQIAHCGTWHECKGLPWACPVCGWTFNTDTWRD